MARRKRFPSQRFDVRAAFKLLASHLVERKDVVRFLAVTTAMERWAEFEAAALIDPEPRIRERLQGSRFRPSTARRSSSTRRPLSVM